MDWHHGFHGPTLADRLLAEHRKEADARVSRDPFWSQADKPITRDDLKSVKTTKTRP